MVKYIEKSLGTKFIHLGYREYFVNLSPKAKGQTKKLLHSKRN